MAIETKKIGIHFEADVSKLIDDVAKANDIFKNTMQKMQSETRETQKVLEEYAKHYGLSIEQTRRVFDRIRKDREEEEQRNTERERIAQNNRRLEMQHYNDRITAVRNLGLAMAGLIAAQATIDKFFDWSKNLTSLDQFSKMIGTATDKVIAFRNAAHENNVEYGSSLGALNRASDYNYKLRYDIGSMSQEQSILARYNSELSNATDSHGREYDATDRMRQWAKALRNFGAYNPQDRIMQRHLAESVAGGDPAMTDWLLSGNINKDLQDHMGQGTKIAGKVKTARDLMQQKAKQDNEKGVIESEAFGNISPIAVKFMEAFNNFLAQHEAMAAFIVNFGQFIILLGTMRSLMKGLPKGVVTGTASPASTEIIPAVSHSTTGSVGSKVTPPSREITLGETATVGKGAIGNAVTPATESITIAETAAKTSRFALSGPVVAGIAAAAAMLYPKQTATDDTFTGRKAADRRRQIETAVNGRLHRSFWSDKLYVEDENGNFIYLNDNNESVNSIKKRMENVVEKRKKTEEKWNPLGWIFPQAHGEERRPDPDSEPHYRRSDVPTKQSSIRPNEAFKAAAEFFTSKGLSAEQTAGLLARMEKESGGRYDAQNPHGSAYGLFQWTTPRQKDFKRVFGYDIHQAGMNDQLRFLWWELNNTEARGYRKLLGANSPYDAGYAVSKDIIRPGSSEAEQLREAMVTGDRARLWYDRLPAMMNGNTTNNNNNSTANHHYSINVHVNGQTNGKALADEIKRNLPGPSHHATQTNNGLW